MLYSLWFPALSVSTALYVYVPSFSIFGSYFHSFPAGVTVSPFIFIESRFTSVIVPPNEKLPFA